VIVAAGRTAHVGVPLYVHILGAILLIGTLLFVASAIVIGWRRNDADDTTLTRHGLRMLLMGVLPSYIVMRIGAQWTESAENFPDDYDPTWLGIGYITADAGALLVLISVVLSVIGLRQLRRDGGGGLGLARAVGVISLLLLAAYVVAVWAMSGKPT
jgi:hypothetical protein